MRADLRADLVEQYLADAAAAARQRDWPQVLESAHDVLLLDADNGDARMLLTLAERHVGRGQPSWGRRLESVLFADLVGSTALANRFDPEFIGRLTRAYELACTPVLTALGGHVHRFVGDGILASFGFPSSHEDDGRRAVEAALDLVDAVAATSERFRDDGAELNVRVGIASGVLVHQDRGGGSWTQLGDLFGTAVNLAARIHEHAEPGEVLISAETAGLVAGYFEVERIGSRELKGFAEPIDIFRVIRRTGARTWIDRRRGGVSPLIGRDAELGQLRDWWSASLAARRGATVGPCPRAVIVIGDPGVGKSRLVREFLAACAPDERATVELFCEAHREASPLYPVRVGIERYSKIEPRDDDDTRLAKLSDVLRASGLDPGEVLPYLLLILGLDAAGKHEHPEVSPAQLRIVALGHLHRWIAQLAVQMPTVVVIEDLQWADPSTLELVERVVASSAPGLMVVATARTQPDWVAGAGFEVVALDSLSRADTAALVQVVGGDDLASGLVEEVVSRSDGIPLFVEQLADALVSTSRSAACASSPIPTSLTELLQARLDGAGTSKRIAQLAATVGREFDPELVEAVVERLVAEGRLEALDRSVPEHVSRLIDSGLVEPDAGDGSRLRFRHALLAQAAYESQLLDERPDRHESIALVLAEGGPTGRAPDPAVVALHFSRAGRPMDAVVQYLLAAQGLHALGAYAELLDHLASATDLVASLDLTEQPSVELAIRLSRALALSATGGYVAPIDEFARAVQLCEELRAVDVPGGTVRALLGLWTYYCVTGQFERTSSICAEMDAQLARAQFAGGHPSVDACRGVEAFFTGDLRTSAMHLERARELFGDDDIDPTVWPLPHDPLGAVLAFAGPVRLILGDEEGALEAIAAGLERSRAQGFPLGPFTEAFVRNYEAWMHRLRGAYDDAASAAQAQLDIGERHGFFDWIMAGRMHVAAAAAAVHPTLDMLDELGEAIAIWRSVGAQILLPSLTLERAWGYVALDELDRAGECLRTAEEMMSLGQHLSRSDAHRLRAELAARAGAPTDEVLAELRAGIRSADRQHAPLFVLRCEETLRRWIDIDDIDDETRDALERARSVFTRRFDAPVAGQVAW